jgi:hypothetical protein
MRNPLLSFSKSTVSKITTSGRPGWNKTSIPKLHLKGPDYEKGLSNLKTLAENQPHQNPAPSDSTVKK